ncbi:MAG: ABC transporter permease [Proteobacteria bacterium]|nr:ABC transporter permease [Pseudomonadota bacterium]
MAAEDFGDTLRSLRGRHNLAWDGNAIDTLDSAGAIILWRVWGRRFPDRLRLSADHLAFLRQLESLPAASHASQRPSFREAYLALGSSALRWVQDVIDAIALLGGLVLTLLRLIRYPRNIPWREISANLYKGGVRAIPITALVGSLIGVVLAYLFALQLRQLGADAFIVNVLGIGIVREVGPLLTAVLVAGRSGSAMTAQLGVMRVTEEIDALAAMGIPIQRRLILPKVLALALAVPLLVLWTSAVAMIGGALCAWIQLDITPGLFFHTLPKVVPVANLWIGLAKGMAFGIAVAYTACHFGLQARPNTESLAANTTASVVVSITAVILLDAVFAIATSSIGVPSL